MGDKQLEIEVLGLFAGELPNTVARLEGAQSERDWRLAAHTMKGSARAVGAWRVARAAQAAEQFRFDAAETDERRAAMGPITAAVSEALIYIRELSAAN
ncbi:MAG: Hpt domain-containing protein [Hyphomicrobium sp.]|nr:Hpt domain-containing protein [Hyphomicrobium sp.]